MFFFPTAYSLYTLHKWNKAITVESFFASIVINKSKKACPKTDFGAPIPCPHHFILLELIRKRGSFFLITNVTNVTFVT